MKMTIEYISSAFILILLSHYGESQINCIQAREQCFGEGRCNEALGIFKKVCGPELAACTTVTQNKCRRVLRTLQSYDYLIDCKCGEPHMDFACYTFRGTIFNHPCDNMNPNEQEALLVLPTCNQALKECRSEPACFKDYTEFLKYCKYSKGGMHCQSIDVNQCHKSWAKVRQSHVFGCICPPDPRPQAMFYGRPNDKLSMIRDITHSDHTSSYCLKTYNETHRNPCLTPQGHSKDNQIEEVQQTCHRALKSCQNDDIECLPLLNNVMMWCEHTHCEPDRCREALQSFYARVNIRRRLEVAFCVCRQNDPDGQCLTAMRKLHPTCAQRQAGRDEKKCNEIAQQCKRNRNCRQRLEEYERNCSADVMTGKCSGTHRACQFAVTKILGTELHASCVCKGTDFLHQRDCYTWQKLLWANPCVIESHLALQEELRKGKNLDDIFTKAPISTTTPTPPRILSTPGNMENPYGSYGTMVYNANGQYPPRGQTNNEASVLTPDGGSMFSSGRGRGRGTGINFGRDRNSGAPFGGRNQFNRKDCQPGDSRCQGPPPSWGGRNSGTQIGKPDPGRGRGGLMVGINNAEREKGGRGQFQGRHRGGGFGRDNTGGGRNNGIWRNGNGKLGSGRNNWRNGGVAMTPMTGVGRVGGDQGMYMGGGNRFGIPPRADDINQDGSRSTYFQKSKGFPPNNNNAPAIPPQYNGNNIQPEYDIIPTTTETTSTTVPPRYCDLKGSSHINEVENIKIAEGTWKRIYKDDCSVLCQCPQSNPNEDLSQARCHTLGCIPHKGCNTTQAQYHHSSPSYLRYRGECICYYGNFICQRPDPAETKLSLGPGIYLLLGFSKTEMELLKHHTGTDELEALTEIENLLIRKYGFKCRLITKEQIGENLIVLSELRIQDESYMNPTMKQRKEREECIGPLNELTNKINARPRHPEVSEDAYLSMFILAELHVNLPEAQTSPSVATSSMRSSLWILLASIGLLLALACVDQQPMTGFANLKLFSQRIPEQSPSAIDGTSSSLATQSSSYSVSNVT